MSVGKMNRDLRKGPASLCFGSKLPCKPTDEGEVWERHTHHWKLNKVMQNFDDLGLPSYSESVVRSKKIELTTIAKSETP